MQPEPKVNILLVDDHSENLLALEAILDNLGQNLVKAHSGEEALRCLLNQDFAVILLDVQMPGMDGFEAATLIRSRERSRDTPIIFLTAFSSSDRLVWRGYSLGAVDYLLKPIDPQILTSKVAVFVELFKKTAQIKQQATQLAAVNAELKTSEERFRSLSACSPVGIFLSDITGRCTYTNPRCQAICGFTLEESLEAGWLQSVHPEDRQQVLANWSAYTREGKEYSDEFRFLSPEGIVRWTHFRSSPMLSDRGELVGYVGTVEDITERKQGEEARAEFIREQSARQQAEAANRMKDEFLATLSHELRTPLNSMLGWARLLRTRKFDENTTARALETIERNAKLQAQLIEDILDVTRIIQGKVRLNFRSVNLVNVIETAIDGLRPAAEAKAINLELSLANLEGGDSDNSPESSAPSKLTNILKSKIPNPKFSVSGDSDRLQQVVWNLLSNAIKFTPEGGKVEVQLESASSYVQIKVRDTGIGITPQFLPYIFDRFRQADSTTTRSQGGLGLGLAIVRNLVELHCGNIYADSKGAGQGATFTVKLPLAGCQISDAEKAHPMESDVVAIANLPSLKRLQVLVVDDDTDTRDFMTTVLEQYEAQVTAVASVSEAMEALEQLRPDVLVSDIGMPGEDGYGLISKVRALEEERGGRMPALALTAYARVEERTHALKAGFQMHMTKPIEPAELIAVVAQLAQQNATKVK
ncbi:MAG: response regulator [Aphanothece sp. CMT-3BRIN-NPC111]|jgi:hypothetical protein|nr:response regulator [Aphanothece sp. CMT-3BRIN-NPC111]